MKRLFVGMMIGLPLSALSCSHVTHEPTVETHAVTASHAYLGDGMEVRCYRVTVDDEELKNSLAGLGGTLISEPALAREGIEYYDLPSSRIEDLALVISDGNAWHVRWFGQQFNWSNLLPGQSSPQAVALPARTWSMMLEDGPVVHFEAMPVVLKQDGRVARKDLRIERRLRPGHCLVLMGDKGLDGELLTISGGDEEEPSLGLRMYNFTETEGAPWEEEKGGAGGRDVLVLLPRFTNARRLPPLRSPQ